MPRGRRPDGLEMNNLQLQPSGATSPRSPLTPTIKLSRPPSSVERKSSLSYTLIHANEEVDLVNGGFINNEKTNGKHKHHANGNGASVFNKLVDGGSIDNEKISNHKHHANGNGVAGSDTSRANGNSKASHHRPSPAESWSSGASNGSNHTNGDIAGVPHNANSHNKNSALFSVSQCLMPPISKGKSKRHSLPLPGQVDSSSIYSLKSSPSSVSLKEGRYGDTSVDLTTPHTNGGSSNSVSLLPHSMPSPTKSGASPWKRWFGRKSSQGSEHSSFSDASALSSAECEDVDKKPPKLQSLVKSIRRRVSKLKSNEVAPIDSAPATSSGLAPPPQAHLAPPNEHNEGGLKPTSVRKRLDSFAPSSVGDDAEDIHFKNLKIGHFSNMGNRIKALRFPEYFDPLSTLWLVWLSVVTMAFLYNAIVIFLRGSFVSYQKNGNLAYWLCFDYLCDIIYIADMLLFRPRLMFFQAGQGITDKRCMLTNYTSSGRFKMDLFSLLPLDLFYLLSQVGVNPLLRLPRLLKAPSYLEFSQKFENKSKSAHGIRVFRMVCYLLYMIHLNTCLYYAVLTWEGIRTDPVAKEEEYWTYLDPNGDAYTRCLFRSAKTLIVIGNLPAPNTDSQIIFMNIDFVVGVFVFASMIGQMRDISAKSGATQDAFRRRMDDTMKLLQVWKIPKSIQKRVRQYYVYSWDNGAVLDERDLLGGVPLRMQTDIAINVHMDTLSRVSLFQDCDKMLLRDLVLKLRPMVYLPNEFICKKGAVGKEMYIVVDGSVQVLGGEKNCKVLATLQPGSVFGEISLLSVGVGNRRTADVVSPGFANLFVLDKKDLQEVVVNYPDAQESLKKKAREILKQNQANETKNKKRRGKSLIAESILNRVRKNSDPNSTPTFFNAVLQVARTKRITATILKGSFNMKSSAEEEDDSRFAYYSSSDISTDEEGLVPIKKRKRPRFIKKKGLLRETLQIGRGNEDGMSSSMDGRSDSDCPEPMAVIVHPTPGSGGEFSPKYNKNNKRRAPVPTPITLPNQVPDETALVPVPIGLLDQALPSPGLSSSMVTDNDPLENEHDEAQDSGVDVPAMDGSAGALTGASFDDPTPDGDVPRSQGGMAVAPPPRQENAAVRSEANIEPPNEPENTVSSGDRETRGDGAQKSTTPTPAPKGAKDSPSRPRKKTPTPPPPAVRRKTPSPPSRKGSGDKRPSPVAGAGEPTSPPSTQETQVSQNAGDGVCTVEIEREDEARKDKEDEEEKEKKKQLVSNDEVIEIEADEEKAQEGHGGSSEDGGSSVDPQPERPSASAQSKKAKIKRQSSESSQRAFKANVQYDPRSIYTSLGRTDRPKSKSGPKSAKKRQGHGDRPKKE